MAGLSMLKQEMSKVVLPSMASWLRILPSTAANLKSKLLSEVFTWLILTWIWRDCWHDFKENCLNACDWKKWILRLRCFLPCISGVHLHVFESRYNWITKCALEQIPWICWQVFVWKRVPNWWEYKRLLSFNSDRYFYFKAKEKAISGTQSFQIQGW